MAQKSIRDLQVAKVGTNIKRGFVLFVRNVKIRAQIDQIVDYFRVPTTSSQINWGTAVFILPERTKSSDNWTHSNGE